MEEECSPLAGLGFCFCLAVRGLPCSTGFSPGVDVGTALCLQCLGSSSGLLPLLQTMGSRACGLSSCRSQALEHRLWSARA